MSNLILVRHGKSIWNELGLWTGCTDVELHDQGKLDAKKMALCLIKSHINLVFTSKLKRAKDTAKLILDELHLKNMPIIETEALNERDYGVHTGKNKWEVKKEVGEEEFQRIRRDWNHPIPGGETLKDVHDRVVPYFKNQILPKLKEGKNILIAAHGNSLRALTKYLCDLSEAAVCNLEFGIGEVHVYEFNSKGKILNYEIKGESIGKI